jgi:hypothetical protein
MERRLSETRSGTVLRFKGRRVGLRHCQAAIPCSGAVVQLHRRGRQDEDEALCNMGITCRASSLLRKAIEEHAEAFVAEPPLRLSLRESLWNVVRQHEVVFCVRLVAAPCWTAALRGEAIEEHPHAPLAEPPGALSMVALRDVTSRVEFESLCFMSTPRRACSFLRATVEKQGRALVTKAPGFHSHPFARDAIVCRGGLSVEMTIHLDARPGKLSFPHL